MTKNNVIAECGEALAVGESCGIYESAYNLIIYAKSLEQQTKFMRDYELSLNKRASVEQELFDVANGSKPILTKEQCRKLALKLGVPDNWRKK